MVLDGEAFDFIVVGGGTGGCVLAARLSEDRVTRVLLLEAGPEDKSPWIHVPAAVGKAMFEPEIGWGYWTVPQPHMNDRKIPVPRGRVLGGSGSMNGMVYNRGQPKDYDDWAAAGNTGWSYAEVLPYFTRSEHNENFEASIFHGRGGPMNVKSPPILNPMTGPFQEAMAALQFRRNDDFNTAAGGEGFGPRQGCIKDGRRVSQATAFLRPALGRSNLTLETDAPVARVLIENGRATGVQLIDGRRLMARREVVIAGGAVASPQILLLSGVGDAKALQALGIEVKADRPSVGADFHDHLATSVQNDTDDISSYGISPKALPRGVWNILEYVLARKGPLAGNVFETNAFVRTLPELDRPDIQLVFQPAKRNKTTFPIPIRHGYGLSTVLLYPKSRGSIRLASADPREVPLIDPNLLGDERDFGPLLRGIRLSRRIFEQPVFDKYRGVEIQPGPAAQSDDDLKAYIRNTAGTVHHPCGSCRMGADKDSVVDPQLRVRGVEGLRVADASIFPTLVGGNTNAVVVMVAEKAADMILGKPALKAADLSEAA